MRKIPLLSTLASQQLAQVATLMRERRFQRGDAIYTAEDQSQDIYLIEQGEAWIYRETPFGPQPLAELSGGALFGELPLLDGGARSGEAQARSFATIWQIDGARLQDLFRRSPSLVFPFYRAFWRSLAQQIHRANQYVEELFGSQLTGVQSGGRKGRLFGEEPGPVMEPGEDLLSGTGHPGMEVDPQKKYQVLESIGLTPEETNLLLLNGKEITLPAGARLFREGDRGDSLCFILHGEIRISKVMPGIGEEALAFLGPGEIFGEMALATEDSLRSADCTAHEGPVLLLAFSRASLEELEWATETDLPFLAALCKMMARRLREIHDKLVCWRMMAGGF
ncbi:MAG: cyclic nucleotide-binding domain-containing protein [Bradymonadales bacterium]|nr:cyclic nucleotide-binding domain-containing protein [Bradymonadales bacterium]